MIDKECRPQDIKFNSIFKGIKSILPYTLVMKLNTYSKNDLKDCNTLCIPYKSLHSPTTRRIFGTGTIFA